MTTAEHDYEAVLDAAETIARIYGDTETARRLTELIAEVREGGHRGPIPVEPEARSARRLRIGSVTIDCADVARLAAFWSEALGYTSNVGEGGGFATVEDPADRDVEIVFVRVPEGKSGKNRVHIDIGANDRDAEVARLVELGAEEVERFPDWTVMRDPEGNEFCIVQAAADDPVEQWRTS